MFRSANDHPKKARQHVEDTTLTLVIVHQVESKFYIKILINSLKHVKASYKYTFESHWTVSNHSIISN
jgi:hypothetical protein